MIQPDEATMRRLIDEVYGEGREELLTELVAAEYIGHLPLGTHYGPDGVRIDVAAWRAAFPDLSVAIDELFVCDERIVRRFELRGTHRGAFLGFPASGQRIAVTGMAIDRLETGKLVESWEAIDLHRLLRQIGAIDPPERGQKGSERANLNDREPLHKRRIEKEECHE
jgi:steroid delta-isomerase-like uncharacterized protein